MTGAIAILTAAVLTAIAGLHVYWAAGGRWPGHDDASLEAIVVGNRPGSAMPGALACLAIAIAIGVAAIATLAGHWLAWIAAGALAVRGLEGFVDHRLRPYVIGTSFARLNRVVYSPLCLALAAGMIVTRLS